MALIVGRAVIFLMLSSWYKLNFGAAINSTSAATFWRGKSLLDLRF
jgi:hypothetical protein